MKTTTIHPWKLALFALLSVADLLLTLHLIKNSFGHVYESNPLARWCFDGYGWLGLAGFKLAMVLFIGGLAVVISRYRPRTGSFLLTFGCGVTAVVVLYSFTLGQIVTGKLDARWLLGEGPDAELAVGPYDPGAHVAALVDDLRGEDDEMRRQAARDLGQLGADAAPAVPHLMANIRRLPREQTRFEQMALARIGAPAVESLKEALRSESEAERQLARTLLERIERGPNQPFGRNGYGRGPGHNRPNRSGSPADADNPAGSAPARGDRSYGRMPIQ